MARCIRVRSREIRRPVRQRTLVRLARTIWALGEGYSAFHRSDPAFADSRRALDLAIHAINRQVLDPRYGRYQVVDGQRLPAWLIADDAGRVGRGGAGLSAYVARGAEFGSPRAGPAGGRDCADADRQHSQLGRMARSCRRRRHARCGTRGIANATALAAAAVTLKRPALLRPAIGDSASFDPQPASSRAG